MPQGRKSREPPQEQIPVYLKNRSDIYEDAVPNCQENQYGEEKYLQSIPQKELALWGEFRCSILLYAGTVRVKKERLPIIC